MMLLVGFLASCEGRGMAFPLPREQRVWVAAAACLVECTSAPQQRKIALCMELGAAGMLQAWVAGRRAPAQVLIHTLLQALRFVQIEIPRACCNTITRVAEACVLTSSVRQPRLCEHRQAAFLVCSC